jgi:hypothetical protein
MFGKWQGSATLMFRLATQDKYSIQLAPGRYGLHFWSADYGVRLRLHIATRLAC